MSDVNECVVNPQICGSNAQCSNNEGSYSCTCNEGYEMTGKGCVGEHIIILKLLTIYLFIYAVFIL